MSYFFKRRIWMLKFDPNFVQSSRKEKKAKGSPIQQLSAKRMMSRVQKTFRVMRVIRSHTVIFRFNPMTFPLR